MASAYSIARQLSRVIDTPEASRALIETLGPHVATIDAARVALQPDTRAVTSNTDTSWERVAFLAEIVTDPATLSRIARTDKRKRVRRALARNKHLAAETRDFLSNWAITFGDTETSDAFIVNDTENEARRFVAASVDGTVANGYPTAALSHAVATQVTDPDIWNALLRHPGKGAFPTFVTRIVAGEAPVSAADALRNSSRHMVNHLHDRFLRSTEAVIDLPVARALHDLHVGNDLSVSGKRPERLTVTPDAASFLAAHADVTEQFLTWAAMAPSADDTTRAHLIASEDEVVLRTATSSMAFTDPEAQSILDWTDRKQMAPTVRSDFGDGLLTKSPGLSAETVLRIVRSCTFPVTARWLAGRTANDPTEPLIDAWATDLGTSLTDHTAKAADLALLSARLRSKIPGPRAAIVQSEKIVLVALAEKPWATAVYRHMSHIFDGHGHAQSASPESPMAPVLDWLASELKATFGDSYEHWDLWLRLYGDWEQSDWDLIGTVIDILDAPVAFLTGTTGQDDNQSPDPDADDDDDDDDEVASAAPLKAERCDQLTLV